MMELFLRYRILLAGLFLATAWACPAQAEMRVWTSVEGRKMEAVFVRLETVPGGAEVVFRMPTGMHARVPLSQLSAEDQAHIRAKADQGAAAAVPDGKTGEAVEPTRFEKFLAEVIRYPDRGSLRRRAPGEFQPVPYYAFYFSAEWCPPCREFTPKLVQFYNEQKAVGAGVEVIFVSADQDDRAMRTYVNNYSMSYPVVDFRRVAEVRDRVERWGGGIPNLVVVDREGKVLFQAYEKGSANYLGPTSVLNRLRPLLAK